MAHHIIGSPLQLPDGTALPLSKGVRAGDFVFLSGQLGLDAGGRLVEGIEAQVEQCLRNVAGLLAEAGLGLEHVVKATVWLTDVADFAAFNRVYAAAFAQAPPARSTVVSALVLPGAKVEIEVVAFAG